jgi:lysophospholipase L1-like esterase
MKTSGFVQSHPRWTGLALAAAVLVAGTLGTEIVLSHFFPYSIYSAGFVHTGNGKHYGWGFDPGQAILVIDPDTGARHVSRANQKGWRDRERNFENPGARYRVLVMGDSQTFGYTVPEDAQFTRRLEDRLAADKLNAEIINISYPGWSIDQQLVAFRREGIRYRPDMVILHFSINDLWELHWYEDSGKFARRKPFYFVRAPNGAVVRRANPKFQREWNAWTRRRIIATSEILKHAWVIYDQAKARRATVLNLDEKHLALVFHLLGAKATGLVKSDFGGLAKLAKFEAADLDALLARHGLEDQRDAILTIARNWYRFGLWDMDYYRTGSPKKTPAHWWPDYLAMLAQFAAEVRAAGAGFAISVDHEKGRLAWHQARGLIARSEQAAKGFLGQIAPLMNFAKANGIAVIANKLPLQRSANNVHINREGNAALAGDYYRYLKDKIRR